MSLRFHSCLLLINPSRYPKMVRALERRLRGATGVELVVTKSKTHFLDCAREFVDGPYRNLLVWGGDGTAHDAINALYPALRDSESGEAKAVGFLRGGTGNGIQDSYEVPYRLSTQLATYARSTRNRYTISVDLIRVDDGVNVRYGQLVGVGLDAEILERRERRRRKHADGQEISQSGVIRYIVAGISRFFAGDLKQSRSIWDIELCEGKYAFRGPRVNAAFPIARLTMKRSPLMIEVGTRPYYGKLFRVCPDVVCNDGNIDLYLYDFSSRAEILRNLVYLWTGWHSMINRRLSRARKPVIERYQVREARIESELPFDYHIDGELLRVEPTTDGQIPALGMKVVPEAMTFLVPAAFYHIFHPFAGNPDIPDVRLEPVVGQQQ
ncbi:MAG: diacylglycerol/lipid kinase family protein [Spirochaetales bacterium]